MKWSSIHSIEFFRMPVRLSYGKSIEYVGAVLFGPPREQGCEVLRIATPMPSPDILHQELAAFHCSRLREKVVLKNWSKPQLIQALEVFCADGIPMPSVFDDSFAELVGFSPFQVQAYRIACTIPHGETRSYSWLGGCLRKERAERAVGRAMRVNPFPLLIPCHRVVKKDGNLGGYMGVTSPESWQILLKKEVLALEGLYRQPSLFEALSGRRALQ